MVLEAALIEIKSGLERAFEFAFAKAQHHSFGPFPWAENFVSVVQPSRHASTP